MSEKPLLELGDLLKTYIRRSGKTQRQVAEEAGIPSPTYLSQMANARVNWVASEYFRPLSKALSLSIAEIAELNPDLIVTNEPVGAVVSGSLTLRADTNSFEVSDSLKETIRQYGDNFPKLRETRWQRWLATTDFREEPETPEHWLAVFLDFEKKINPR